MPDATLVSSKGPLGIFSVIGPNSHFTVYAWICTNLNSCFNDSPRALSGKSTWELNLVNFVNKEKFLAKAIRENLKTEIISPIDETIKYIENLKPGTTIKSRVMSIKRTQVNFYLGKNVRGRLHVLEVPSVLNSVSKVGMTKMKRCDLRHYFKPSQIIETKILGFHDAHSHRYLPYSHKVSSSVTVVDLTMKTEGNEKGGSTEGKEKGCEMEEDKTKSVDGLIVGYVESVKKNVATVRIGRKTRAQMPLLRAGSTVESIKEMKRSAMGPSLSLSNFLMEIADTPPIDTIVAVRRTLNPVPTLDNVLIGMKLVGIVASKSVTSGLILRLSSSLYGRVHLTDISHTLKETPTQLYEVGQYLDCEVVSIDKEKRRIDLSMKGYNEDLLESEQKKEGKNLQFGYIVKKTEEYLIVEISRNKRAIVSVSETLRNTNLLEEGLLVKGRVHEMPSGKIEMKLVLNLENDTVTPIAPIAPPTPPPQITVGIKPLIVTESEDLIPRKRSSEDSNNNKPSKRERSIYEPIVETNNPVEEKFERLLFASPNSSYLWIKFMAFQLSLSNLEKSRSIAKRALSKINFRKEKERLNVWVAWMNLENAYGSQTLFEEVVKNASLQVNPKFIYLTAANILIKSNKDPEPIYKEVIKKFSTSYKVWKAYILYFFRKPDLDSGRLLLQKALEILPKKKHIKIVSTVAQLEFKYGVPERGRTIFEGILKSNPKRMDIWSIYIDMEIKSLNFINTRLLFERLSCSSLPPKKMKFVFKKYINFEIDHGTPQNVEKVKQAAVSYLENNAR